jgi:plastocyanin
MRRFVAVLLSVFAVAATGVVGFALAGPSQHKAQTVTDVNVTMGEYYFTLSTMSAPVGTVVFHVTNQGDLGHDFAIAGQKTAILEKGQSANLTVNFSQPGGYNYLCTVGEHAIYGMAGNFQITGQATTTVITTNGTTVVTTGTTPTPPPPPIRATVNVGLKEFRILLTQKKKVRVKRGNRYVLVIRAVAVKSVPAGRVRFLVKNIGRLPHNFVTNQQQTAVLASKKSQTLVVTFSKKGNYVYLCSITGHAAAGMKGTLKVT